MYNFFVDCSLTNRYELDVLSEEHVEAAVAYVSHYSKLAEFKTSTVYEGKESRLEVCLDKLNCILSHKWLNSTVSPSTIPSSYCCLLLNNDLNLNSPTIFL